MDNEQSTHTSAENSTPAQPKKGGIKGLFKEILLFVLIAFGIVLPFRFFVAEPYLVDGRSMYPTFNTGDYLIVDKLSYRFKKPERNSVIVFKYPNNTKKNFIKRIIGLPGETVVINDNTVKIINEENPDGFTIDEPYVVYDADGSTQVTLGDDEYFVMGDNRAESFDSRSWGPVKSNLLLGKPILRLFPINKIEVTPGSVNQ